MTADSGLEARIAELEAAFVGHGFHRLVQRHRGPGLLGGESLSHRLQGLGGHRAQVLLCRGLFEFPELAEERAALLCHLDQRLRPCALGVHHGFEPRKSSGTTFEANLARAVEATVEFLADARRRAT